MIFATDYDNYAGIFTCQKITLFHRQSATILSRTRDLDKAYVEKLRAKLANFQVDPFDLTNVPQTNCPRGNNSFDLNVDPNTFSAKNIGDAVKKAGEKIGDGVEWIGNQSSKVFHKITGSSDESNNKSDEDRRYVRPNPPTNLPALPKQPAGKIENNEVEWIP